MGGSGQDLICYSLFAGAAILNPARTHTDTACSISKHTLTLLTDTQLARFTSLYFLKHIRLDYGHFKGNVYHSSSEARDFAKSDVKF